MTAAQYWRLSRPITLVATASPVLLGTACAWRAGPVSWALAAGFALVALLLQIGTNLLNEAADYARGVDDAGSEGIAGVIVRGELSHRAVERAAFATLSAALVVGLALAYFRGPLLFALGVVGIATVAAYNAGPRPVSATPWGELLVFAVMGPIEVLAAEIAAGGAVTWLAALLSGSVGLCVAAILLANNLRDAEPDATRGRRTLVAVIGRPAGLRVLAAGTVAAIVWPLCLTLTGAAPGWLIVIVIAAPWAAAVARRALSPAPAYPALLPLAARLHLAVGVLLAAGIVLR